MPKQGISEKPQVGQGRAGLRKRKPEPDHINQPSDVTRGIPGGSKIVTEKTNSSQGTNSMCDRAINNDKPFLPDVPLHLDPLHKPSSLQQNTNKINQNSYNYIRNNSKTGQIIFSKSKGTRRSYRQGKFHA